MTGFSFRLRLHTNSSSTILTLNILSPFFFISPLKFFSIAIGSNSSSVLACDSAATQKFRCRLHLYESVDDFSVTTPYIYSYVTVQACIDIRINTFLAFFFSSAAVAASSRALIFSLRADIRPIDPNSSSSSLLS